MPNSWEFGAEAGYRNAFLGKYNGWKGKDNVRG